VYLSTYAVSNVLQVEQVNKVVGRELGFSDPVFTLRPMFKVQICHQIDTFMGTLGTIG